MRLLFYILNIFLIWYSWKKFRDFLNPITVLLMVWTSYSGFYEILSRMLQGYRILSVCYYLYVSLFLYLFCIISFFILRNIRKKITSNSQYFVNNLNISEKNVNLILKICILANIFFVLVLIFATGTFNPIEVMSNIRLLTRGDSASTLASLIKIPAILFNFTPLILAYIFMYRVKADNRKVIFLMIEMLLISFLLATKGRLIRFTLLLLIMFKKKLSKRKFAIVSAITIPLALFVMYVLVMNRDGAYFEVYTLSDYLFLYFLSPIPGLDRLLCGELTYLTQGLGPRTLEYFYQLLAGFLGTSIPRYIDPGYINISTSNGIVTTNVLTGLGVYYLDYSVLGAVVCAVFFAFIYTSVYKKMVKGKTGYAIFYMINFPYLFFHVFGDLIITSISITLQELLSAIFLTYYFRKIRFMWGKK